MVCVLESANWRVELVASENTGQKKAPEPSIKLTRKAHGKDITQVTLPVARVDIHDRIEQRDAPDMPLQLVRAEIQNEESNDQLHLELVNRRYDIGLSLRLTLRADGGLEVRLKISEIQERDSGVHRLLAVHVLPGLLHMTADIQGLLPLATGRLFDAAGVPEMDDRFMLYGEQSRWELLPVLPIASIGADPTKGNISGLAVLATQCAEDTLIRVRANGKGSAWIDTGFSLRERWDDVVDSQDRVLRYVPLPETMDLLHGSANVLHRYLTDELDRPTLAQEAAENPQLRQMLGSYTMKMFFAVQHHGWDPARCQYHALMNFDEAGDALKRIKAAGIDRVVTQSVGFIERGHDGTYPSHVNIDPRLGGPEGFARMLKVGHDLGFGMNVHDNYNEAYESSEDFNPEHLFIDEYGQWLKRGRWGGGQSYLQDMLHLPKSRIEDALAQVKALGLSGMGYVDAVGNPLYRNYDAKRPGPRSNHARGICRVLDAARKGYGAVGIECGFLYALLSADSFVMPSSPHGKVNWPAHWPISKIGGQNVPLVNLALSGLWSIETGHNMNWAKTAQSLMLGKHPRTEWTIRDNNGHAPLLTDESIARFKAIYDLQLVTYAHLQTQQLTQWRRIEPGIEQTVFDDGTTVDFNKHTGELKVNQSLVPMPLCFEEPQAVTI